MIASNPAIELHRNVVILETLHVVHHTRGIVGELKPIASIVSLKLNAMREGIDGPIWGFELVDFKLLGHTKLSEIILHMGVAGRRVFIYFKLNKCSPLTDWQVILFLQRKNNKRQLKKKNVPVPPGETMITSTYESQKACQLWLLCGVARSWHSVSLRIFHALAAEPRWSIRLSESICLCRYTKPW